MSTYPKNYLWEVNKLFALTKSLVATTKQLDAWAVQFEKSAVFANLRAGGQERCQ
jgi:hypothetical protein